MRRFRYPLARLERLRSHEERLARRALGQALADLHEVQNRITVVNENLEVAAAENGVASGLGRALEGGLRSMRFTLERELHQAAVGAERARERYSERRRDLESLRRMRERRYAEWLAEAQREEQNELEEMTRLRATEPRRELQEGR